VVLNTPPESPALQFADVFRGFVTEHRTGSLQVSGDPPITLYVEDGGITYAETPVAPGLGPRLVGSGRVSWEEWTAIRAAGGPAAPVGPTLLKRSIVTDDELHRLLRSVVVDSVYAVVVGRDAGQPAPAAAFTPQRRDWIGASTRLDVGSVVDETRARAARLTRLGMRPEAVATAVPPRGPWVVLTPGQWRTVWRIDGRGSMRDLAWATGLSIVDTMEAVGELVHAGLCRLDLPQRSPAPGKDAPAAAPTVVTPTVVTPTVVTPKTQPAAGAVATGPAAGPQPAPAAEPEPAAAAVETEPAAAPALPKRSRGSALPAEIAEAPENAGERSALPRRQKGRTPWVNSGGPRPVIPKSMDSPQEPVDRHLLDRLLKGLHGED
jgi:hypothetical protein